MTGVTAAACFKIIVFLPLPRLLQKSSFFEIKDVDDSLVFRGEFLVDACEWGGAVGG